MKVKLSILLFSVIGCNFYIKGSEAEGSQEAARGLSIDQQALAHEITKAFDYKGGQASPRAMLEELSNGTYTKGACASYLQDFLKLHSDIFKDLI